MKTSILFIFLGAASSVAANCGYGTHHFPRELQVPVSTFGYNGLNGPLNWFGLNATNILCDEGTGQSPIVLNSSTPTVPGSSFSLSIPDYPDGAEFENLGTNVEVVVNGSLTLDNTTTYNLAQFHVHSPSEHRIESEYFPMEIHFVFTTEDKQTAVIGVPVELCEDQNCTTPLLKSVFSSISDISEPGNTTMTEPLKFKKFLTQLKNASFYTYTGSLTTPPCAEQVRWLVSRKLFSIDPSTYLAVKKVVKYNARYTQDAVGGTNLLLNAGAELQDADLLNTGLIGKLRVP